MFKCIASIFAVLAALCGSALAQSTPGFVYGQVPTAAQWNSYFAAKQDYLGAPPCLVTGCQFTGKIVTAASSTIFASLNVAPGVAPTSPINGDMWMTSAGLFVRVSGVTIGPLSGGTSASFAATAPLAVAFPSGIVTYSITGADGQVLAGAGPAFTATPTLGVAGSTIGILRLVNATSGRIDLRPSVGALGTSDSTFPIGNTTLAGLALNQTYTGANTYTSGGALQVTPTIVLSGSVTPSNTSLWVSMARSGTLSSSAGTPPGSGGQTSVVDIRDYDTAGPTPGTAVTGFNTVNIYKNFSTGDGVRSALNVVMYQPSPTASGSGSFYTGTFVNTFSELGDGGTSSADLRGNYFNYAGICGLRNTANYVGSCVGMELDVVIPAGVTIGNKVGLQIVSGDGDPGSDGAHGLTRDVALLIGKATFTDVGFNYGIQIGNLGFPWPIPTTGTIIGTGATVGSLQSLYGVDFSLVNFTGGCAFRSNSFCVQQSGIPLVGGNAVAVSATTPLVLNATSGVLTCPTCTTGTGGALTAGVTTTSGYSSGQILASTGSLLQAYSISGSGTTVAMNTGPTISSPTFSGTVTNPDGGTHTITALTLGLSATRAGSLIFANATSGSITINPPAGALSSAVWTLQIGTDTFVGRATTDTLTNKTINGASNTLTVLAASQLSGIAPIANGGSGQSSLTAHAVLIGNGASAVVLVSPATTGYPLVSTGASTDPAFQQLSLAAISSIAANTLLGNPSGSASTPTPITLGATLAFSGSVLQTAAHTGDVTTPANSFVTTLATVASAGTTGSSTAIPVVTINAKGLTTSITTAAVVAPAGTLTGATLAAGVTASSLTSVGTLTSLSSGPVSLSGGFISLTLRDTSGSSTTGSLIRIAGNGTNSFVVQSNTAVANDFSSTVTSIALTGGSVAMPFLSSTSAAQTGTVCWTTGTGNLTVDTTTTCLLSSARFKHDIRPLEGSLETVMALKPVSYEYNEMVIGEQIGLVAEDVVGVDDRLVSRNPDGTPRSVRYQQLTAHLIGAIQSLKADNDNLRFRLDAMQGK